jgi:hypothetical protein
MISTKSKPLREMSATGCQLPQLNATGSVFERAFGSAVANNVARSVALNLAEITLRDKKTCFADGGRQYEGLSRMSKSARGY